MSDLRVALRIQANAGNSRREIEQVNRDLRRAGKEGAQSLADESWKAGAAMTKVGQMGATSYKVIRQAMRDTAAQGSAVLRQDVAKTEAELKQLGQAGRQAARDAKAELVKTDREGVQPLARSADRAETSFRRMAQNSGRHLRTLKAVAAGVRGELDRVRSFGSSTMGQLAGFGVGVGAAAGLKSSATLERQLIRTQQTAGMTAEQREEWKQTQWGLAGKYGLPREQIQAGFDTLIASGLSYGQSNSSIDAIAQAGAVTGADLGILAKALIAAASAFEIDLSKPGEALDLLQKMTVAGRLGNAELENLSDIFPVVGQDAVKAGMSREEALAYVEVLSTAEFDPSRLATLAKSSLRMFTNKAYADQVTKATTTKNTPGVQFYDENGNRRPVADVYNDISTRFKRLTTDKERAEFMGAIYKGMDQETITGSGFWLSSNRIQRFRDSARDIHQSGAIFPEDLKDNLSSADAVAGRMKATLGQAVDRMAQPLNKSFADLGTYLLDDLNLSGEQLLAGSVAAGVGGYYAGRGAKAGAGALLNRFLGGPETLKNIAVGKVLEEATGVQSVFVTNWPGGSIGGGLTPELAKPNGPQPVSQRSTSRDVGLLLLTATATQLGGSSGAQSDEDRLAMVPRNKLLSDNEKTYQTAYYQARIAMADQAPAELPYAERERWLSEKARQVAQQQTGLTANGGSIVDARDWAAGLNARMMASVNTPPAASQWVAETASRLDGDSAQPGAIGKDAATTLQSLVSQMQSLVGQPLVVEVRSNDDHIYATVERRAGIEARRGR